MATSQVSHMEIKLLASLSRPPIFYLALHWCWFYWMEHYDDPLSFPSSPSRNEIRQSTASVYTTLIPESRSSHSREGVDVTERCTWVWEAQSRRRARYTLQNVDNFVHSNPGRWRQTWHADKEETNSVNVWKRSATWDIEEDLFIWGAFRVRKGIASSIPSTVIQSHHFLILVSAKTPRYLPSSSPNLGIPPGHLCRH